MVWYHYKWYPQKVKEEVRSLDWLKKHQKNYRVCTENHEMKIWIQGRQYP